jgi:hypothetical protein
LDRFASVPVASLVTDTEAHRVWAPLEPAGSRLTFLAPTAEVERRLVSYGVRPDTIRRTGFPLPPELADERAATANRDRRIRRLQAATLGWRSSSPDHIEPLRLTVAIGGAAAQAERIHGLVGALGPLVSDGRVRLDLVAGTDAALAKRFRRWTAALRSDPVAGHRVSILHHPRFDTYYRRFNELLAVTDLLWTKPSEMVFYAALGLPLVLDDPVGHHEWHNRRWVVSSGAALLRPDPRDAAEWLEHELLNGTVHRAVEDGFSNLPRDGADRVADWLQSEFTDR